MVMAESDESSAVWCPPPPPPSPSLSFPSASSTAELVALQLLSANLKRLLFSPSLADAHITLSSSSLHPPIPIHRCVLSSRSPFFRHLFSSSSSSSSDLCLGNLLPGLRLGPDALKFVLSYIYTGCIPPLPHGAACCADDACPHIACRPAVEFMLEVLHSSFSFEIFELVNLFQRRLIDILSLVGEDDMLSILSVAIKCGKICERLLTNCTDLIGHSSLDFVTLEKTLPPDIVKQVSDSRSPEENDVPDIHVKRILRALDSDDVELLNLLLKENDTTLDDAYALHYAVAHCDFKITTQLLELGIADVNLKNRRGYSVLHVAAMRKEPNIIVSLLTKGAAPSDITPDGRKALQLAKQVTKYSEFIKPLEQGTTASADRLCIEILENAEVPNPEPCTASEILASAGKDTDAQLLYLETRVGLAKALFPEEARIAMENAKASNILESILATDCNLLSNHQRADIGDLIERSQKASPTDDLNQTMLINCGERRSRVEALSRTVETAKRYFPRCTHVIDRYMDHDTMDFGSDASEEDKQLKKRRFEELLQEFNKAFYQDKKELNALSSTTSSISGPRVKSARRKG